ncbi:MAG: rod shape-determining protein MreC [Acidobacteriota bacterium]
MESFFSRYRNALVLIAVLLAQVIGLAVQVRRPDPNAPDKGSVRLIRSWVVNSVSPPEMFFHWVGKSIRGVWSNYVDLIHVRKQDQQLKAQLDQLRLEEDSLAEDARQGQRLQALLGFKEKYIYKTVAAQVIGTSGTEQSHVLLIDKGSDDGIRPDLPVITPDGIVGKTRDVFRHASQVLEISDATSGAGVILEKTRIRGVLRGDTWGQPEIVNVSPDERIQKGETVLTSGGDAIYPRGLAVGVVDRIVPQPEGTLVNVLIRPAANLSRLEEVLVITDTGAQMPAAMEQDLSDAEQKASDVLAERLPSRADPNAPADEKADTPSAGADDNVAPPVKPPQPMHPDHYTPSDTPPAADLVPGQRITNAASAAASGGAQSSSPAPKSGSSTEPAPAPESKPPMAAAKPKPKPATPPAATGDAATPKKTAPAPAPGTNDNPATTPQTTPPQGGAAQWL